MNKNHIRDEANQLIRFCDTRDPFTIAKQIGIHVSFKHDFVDLKGMYTIIKHSRFAILNGNLNEMDMRTVCAHELGHDRFHQHIARSRVLQEFMSFDIRQLPEIEANTFAAYLLIDQNELFNLMKRGCTVNEIACEMRVDTNLILIMMRELRNEGYEFDMPFYPQSNFLLHLRPT